MSPELDAFVFPKIGESDLWAATRPVTRDGGGGGGGASEAASPSAGHPLLFLRFPPALQASLNNSPTRLQAAGVYGPADPREPRLARSLAV